MRFSALLFLVLLLIPSVTFSAEPSVSADQIEFNRIAAEVAGWTAEGDFGSAADEAAAKLYQEARLKELKEKAAEGNTNAQYILGALYSSGRRVPQSYEEAYFWYALAASNHQKWWTVEQRAEAAQHLLPEQISAVDKRVKEWKPTLASSAAEGTGKSEGQDPVQSFRSYGAPIVPLTPEECKQAPSDLDFFRSEAAAGNRIACARLRDAYFNGKGVSQDYRESYFWYLVAATPTDALPAMVDELTKRLTSEQIDATKKRAADWSISHPLSKEPPSSINVFGVLCGKGGRCNVVDMCGDLVAIDCGTIDDGPYLFADRTSKKVVDGCGWLSQGCKLPSEWTCGHPKNYPASQ